MHVIKMSRSKSLVDIRQAFPPLISEQADCYEFKIDEIEVFFRLASNRQI